MLSAAGGRERPRAGGRLATAGGRDRPRPGGRLATAREDGPGKTARATAQGVGAMTAGEGLDRADLVRRAQARGVAASYRDWRGREVEVGSETLAAILAVLGDPETPPRPARPGDGSGDPAEGAFGKIRAPQPQGRSWGFTVQLYALRSLGSWGHGDLRDLADLAAWSARELGAGFVQCSPLHAAEPLPPVSASPYLPMSRRFTSPLYLRIEDIAEYDRLGAGGKHHIQR